MSAYPTYSITCLWSYYLDLYYFITLTTACSFSIIHRPLHHVSLGSKSLKRFETLAKIQTRTRFVRDECVCVCVCVCGVWACMCVWVCEGVCVWERKEINFINWMQKQCSDVFLESRFIQIVKLCFEMDRALPLLFLFSSFSIYFIQYK